MTTLELITEIESTPGIDRLIALVDATLQGQHIHSCFVCGQEFKCKCAQSLDRFICGDCDGEVF